MLVASVRVGCSIWQKGLKAAIRGDAKSGKHGLKAVIGGFYFNKTKHQSILMQGA